MEGTTAPIWRPWELEEVQTRGVYTNSRYNSRRYNNNMDREYQTKSTRIHRIWRTFVLREARWCQPRHRRQCKFQWQQGKTRIDPQWILAHHSEGPMPMHRTTCSPKCNHQCNTRKIGTRSMHHITRHHSWHIHRLNMRCTQIPQDTHQPQEMKTYRFHWRHSVCHRV